VDIGYVYSVPGVVPSGKYTGKILMTDSAGVQLVCYSFEMVFKDQSNKARRTRNQINGAKVLKKAVMLF
jgi:hypothetical protein